jgi:hypothetical protein
MQFGILLADLFEISLGILNELGLLHSSRTLEQGLRGLTRLRETGITSNLQALWKISKATCNPLTEGYIIGIIFQILGSTLYHWFGV